MGFFPSIGSVVNKICDEFLPDAVGDAIGTAVDIMTGNYAGAVANGFDLVEDLVHVPADDVIVSTPHRPDTTSSAPAELSMEGLLEDPNGALDAYQNDPAAFHEFWSGLSDSDRQFLLMNLQQQMQTSSQLTTMMSNLMQSLHDTHMAVARNLSV